MQLACNKPWALKNPFIFIAIILLPVMPVSSSCSYWDLKVNLKMTLNYAAKCPKPYKRKQSPKAQFTKKHFCLIGFKFVWKGKGNQLLSRIKVAQCQMRLLNTTLYLLLQMVDRQVMVSTSVNQTAAIVTDVKTHGPQIAQQAKPSHWSTLQRI